MKLLLLTLCIIFVIGEYTPKPRSQLKTDFEEFIVKFEKKYESKKEKIRKFLNFQKNWFHAEKLNKKEGRAVHGVTKFMDLSKEEFKNMYLTYKQPEKPSNITVYEPPADFVLRDNSKWDWREHGAVTPVKDQGQCGSCWAFSTAEEVESASFMAGNPLEEFSVEQIVSCDDSDGGCNGGDTGTGLQYVINTGGLASKADYPYTSGNGDSGRCKSFNIEGGAIKGMSYATPSCNWGGCNSQNEDQLKTSLASGGPVSICVNAEEWQTYQGNGEIMTNSSCGGHRARDLDHCVQLVGYDTNSSGESYWLVRNSWNTNWGNGGYIYLKLGDNVCGVANEARLAHF